MTTINRTTLELKFGITKHYLVVQLYKSHHTGIEIKQSVQKFKRRDQL